MIKISRSKHARKPWHLIFREIDVFMESASTKGDEIRDLSFAPGKFQEQGEGIYGKRVA